MLLLPQHLHPLLKVPAMENDVVSQAAAALWTAAGDGRPCPPVRSLIGEIDVATAYAVQEQVTERRLREGARLIGRKIGLTAPAVQAQLGVSQPDYGMLFHDMDVAHDSEIVPGRLIQPRVEAEIAFILGRDLEDERLTTADVIGAIAWAAPALEIVDSRIQSWDIRITDTVADNASSGLFVLGHNVRRLDAIDVCGCGMVLECDGKVAASGTGSACLGSPINATLWLARVMASARRPLRAGDVVLSGALGLMVSARPGTAFEARIQGLGAVRVSFGRDGSQ
jgi:2-keto-4-pentenoate hydratase